MALKTYRPITKSSRQMSRIHYSKLLSGHKPLKALKSGGKRSRPRCL
jgi:ribosomal protein L2